MEKIQNNKESKSTHDIELYFVGGTTCKWDGVPQETVNNIVEWFDSKEDNRAFKTDCIRNGETTYMRKELMLFIRVN